jgi:hypothetical protein
VDAKAQVIVACGVLEACIKEPLPHLINVGANRVPFRET